jgi:hypothetical protein
VWKFKTGNAPSAALDHASLSEDRFVLGGAIFSQIRAGVHRADAGTLGSCGPHQRQDIDTRGTRFLKAAGALVNGGPGRVNVVDQENSPASDDRGFFHLESVFDVSQAVSTRHSGLRWGRPTA